MKNTLKELENFEGRLPANTVPKPLRSRVSISITSISSARNTRVASAKSIEMSSYFSMSAEARDKLAVDCGTRVAPPFNMNSMHDC